VRFFQNGRTHEVPAHRVFALTGYHTDTRFFDQLGVIYDKDTLRPRHDPATFETNIAGVYLAGSVIGGRLNAEIFIENGRLHGEILMRAIGQSVV
jgi:thioredoxin reductase (NADPH)